MAIAVLFNPPAMTAAQYDEAMRRLQSTGALPSPGFVHHTCYGPSDRLSVMDIWESQAQFEAFGQKLMPILQSLGIDPGKPTILPLHNVVAA